MRFLIFHAFQCFTLSIATRLSSFPFSISIVPFGLWVLNSLPFLFHSPHPFSFSFSLSFSFFFLPPFEDDALVLLFSKCRTEMREMADEKLKGYASFSLSICFFFDFFHSMFIVSSKTTIFISKSFDFYFQTP
ncbi:hypothetical protein AAZX31_07G210800 [Glycine max]